MATKTTPFGDSFDSYNSKDWYTSNFTMSESWIHNDWSAKNARVANGELTLELNTKDSHGKSFTGGEVQTNATFGYGHYEVTMKASGETGVNSSFFTYTGPYFGNPWNEIDFEFLGKDPTKVSIAYHNGGTSWSKWVDLGFDSSKGFHTYAFDWKDGEITWYADGKQLYHVSDSHVPDTPGKIYMNIWTGMNGWLGNPTFSGSTEAHYQSMSYTPTTGGGGGGTSGTPGTLNLKLMDTETGKAIATITDGATITVDPSDLGHLAVVATVGANVNRSVESVRFSLDGAVDHNAVENIVPYALFGDSNGALKPGLKAGSYTLAADGYAENGGRGTKVAHTDVDFVIAASKPSADIEVKVINTGSGKTVATLHDGDTLDTKALGTDKLGFVARVIGDGSIVDDAESLVFDLSGAKDRHAVENLVPYSLFGDDGHHAHGQTMPDGDYTLSIAAYDHNGGTGTLLAAHDFDFAII